VTSKIVAIAGANALMLVFGAGLLPLLRLAHTRRELLAKLDELRARMLSERPGVVLSRADVARTILWEGIKRGQGEVE